MASPSLKLYVCCVVYFLSVLILIEGAKYVSNLSPLCMKCLCHASTSCNASFGCSRGYCGPFFIPRQYWVEAGKVTLPDDDPDRDNAYTDCSRDYVCSQRIVENYMAKWGMDCNRDGVTDCNDYAALHFYGKDECEKSLSNTNFGRRYATCNPGSGISLLT